MCEHACVHVVSLRSQETLSVITKRLCSSVMLALVSVTLSCAIYKLWVSSSRWYTSVSIFFAFLLFRSWHRAFCCSCTKYLSSLRENGLHILIGEGVRQRCQRAQWVKGQKIEDKGKEWSFLFGKEDWLSWLRVYRHIGAWSKINHFIVYQGKINNFTSVRNWM